MQNARHRRSACSSSSGPLAILVVSFALTPTLASCADDAAPGSPSDIARGDGGPDVDASGHPSPQDGPWSFATLQTKTVTANGLSVNLEFVRADRPDGGHSFLLYQHAVPPGPAPLVIQNEPYDGIDWTGEAIDTRWAAQGPGAQADTDAPSYNGTDKTVYKLQTPEEAANASNVWTVNGFATIRTYARFYAGGNLEDDALDSAAPYFFARTRPQEIDVSRIGSIGASWGGMMAIFGATHAPKDTPPRAVVAISAPSDFVDLWTWSQTTLPAVYPRPAEVSGFYSPYWRRAAATLGTPPSADPARPYTVEGICPGLPGRVLAPHDSWDLLIPVAQAEALAKACSNVEPLYWPRGPIDYQTARFDHGPAATEGVVPSVIALSYAFLVRELARSEAAKIYGLVSPPSLVLHLKLIASAQKRGEDVTYILPRLRELADPRFEVLVAESTTRVSGAKVVADVVNEVYGTSFDEAGVRTQLAAGLPPAP